MLDIRRNASMKIAPEDYASALGLASALRNQLIQVAISDTTDEDL